MINNNKDEYTFLLKFLLITYFFSEDWKIARILKNKLNKEFKLELLLLIKLLLSKSFQLLKVEEGWFFKLF